MKRVLLLILGLLLIFHSAQAVPTFELISNTDYCLVDCEAVLKMNTDGIGRFLPTKENNDYKMEFIKGRRANDISEYSIEIGELQLYYVDEPILSMVKEKIVIDYNISGCSVGFNQKNFKCEKETNVEYVSGYKRVEKSEIVYKDFFKGNVIQPNSEYYIRIRAKKIPKLGNNDVDWVITVAGIRLKQYAWFYGGWTFKKSAVITNNSGVVDVDLDYPLTFSLDTATLVGAGKLQADCDDIRVVCDDVTEKEYSFDICNNVDTNFYLLNDEVITASGTNSDCYVYYGNVGASAPVFDTDMHVEHDGTAGYDVNSSSVILFGQATGANTYYLLSGAGWYPYYISWTDGETGVITRGENWIANNATSTLDVNGEGKVMTQVNRSDGSQGVDYLFYWKSPFYDVTRFLADNLANKNFYLRGGLIQAEGPEIIYRDSDANSYTNNSTASGFPQVEAFGALAGHRNGEVGGVFILWKQSETEDDTVTLEVIQAGAGRPISNITATGSTDTGTMAYDTKSKIRIGYTQDYGNLESLYQIFINEPTIVLGAEEENVLDPDTNVTQPNVLGVMLAGGSSYTIKFNVQDGDSNTLLVDLNYSQSTTQGDGVEIINDMNTTGASITCVDSDFIDVTSCEYIWTVVGIDGNRFITILVEDERGVTAYDASDYNILIDNTIPVLSDPLPSSDFDINWATNIDANVAYSETNPFYCTVIPSVNDINSADENASLSGGRCDYTYTGTLDCDDEIEFYFVMYDITEQPSAILQTATMDYNCGVIDFAPEIITLTISPYVILSTSTLTINLDINDNDYGLLTNTGYWQRSTDSINFVTFENAVVVYSSSVGTLHTYAVGQPTLSISPLAEGDFLRLRVTTDDGVNATDTVNSNIISYSEDITAIVNVSPTTDLNAIDPSRSETDVDINDLISMFSGLLFGLGSSALVFYLIMKIDIHPIKEILILIFLFTMGNFIGAFGTLMNIPILNNVTGFMLGMFLLVFWVGMWLLNS